MEEFNDTLNPENTAYSTFPARSDGSVRPYSTDKVTALALSANLLFVGTEKGVVTQYMVEEQETDCTCFMYTELMARYISDSPISKIGCCLSTNLLVILNDQVLTLCDAEQLERSGFNLPCRDVITFNLCTWDAASAKLSVAFASKRIGIYLLTNNTAELIFETSLNSVPKSLCLTTNFLGVVVSNQYLSVNLSTKTVIELLQFDPASVRSFITVVEKDVFFIAGPGSLGVVVAATGTSQHNPIQMSPNILDVFVWKDYIYAVTDEFFTIHSLQNQTQVQTVLISNATAACFTPDSMHFVFVSTWCPHSSKTDLVAVGPERWDKFARQLILAGCLNEARQLVIKQKRHMTALVEQRPASSKNEQNVYLKRSRRVFGLLGFYYFEQGVFTSAQTFFEKAVIDIRELLYRYEDLLPRGYAFQPDPFYQLIVTEPSGTDQDGTEMSARSVTDLCLLHALREANGRAMSTGDANPNPDVTSQWAARYDQFLFDFLQKHHKSRFTEFACHFLETALVKLYLKLSKHGIRPTLNELILPIDRLEMSQLRMLSYDPHDTNRNAAHDLIQLISSLIHIDVDDLVIFLRHAEAHHALALIYQWQGNLSAALDVWQRLAYGELKDEYFPGDEFYLAVLHSLTVPDKEGQIEHQTAALSDLASVNTSDHFVPSAYTELVWQHLCRALDANKFELCEKILSGIPVPPKYGDSPPWIRPSTQTQTHPESTVTADTAVNSDPMLAPSQLLIPENILNRILPRHPELARKYLHQLIYKHGDCVSGTVNYRNTSDLICNDLNSLKG
ncbi:Transforming growth factor-beta receptor-associated protein 1 [Fasciola gigantica]|uniref:Transforming growth factor-beta receptor-associated protein 1 n=1 Tax=Fasciola gigantica TaxID=46835 RepID=A0A504YWR9_FASGI|nr:Transforming growth factor-beta receptor-associated protein 1 [Fasciola gigantica]